MKKRTGTAILGAAALGGLAWLARRGYRDAHRLEVTRSTLELSRWPKELDGYTVAVVGDLHLDSSRRADQNGMRAMELAAGADPDLIAIVGDTLDSWHPHVLDRVQRIFEPIRSCSAPVVAIPGNHDYYDGDAASLAATLEGIGVHYLINQRLTVGEVDVIGIDSAGRGRPRLDQVMGDAEGRPEIVLWHEPDLVDALWPGPALMLAGHTHGGQVAPSIRKLVASADHGHKYVSGFYAETPVPLFVTRGVGTSLVPLRLWCPPEVAILELRSKTPKPA